MIIILKKDGQIVTDDGNPVEGAKLENAAAVLADPKDGDSIVYDATAGMWVAGTGGGSFDPDITNPQDGDTLVYDGTAGKWVNGSGGGSGGGALMVGVEQSTGTLSKTWKEIHDAALVGPVILLIVDTGSVNHVYANGFYASDGGYQVYFGENAYATDNENGYPVFT